MEANAPSAAGAAASKPRFCLGWMKAGDTICQHSTNAAAPRHTLSTLRRPWRAILIQTGDLNLSCRLRVEKTLSNVRQEAKVTSPPCFVCFSWNGQALCTQTPRTMHCILHWPAYSLVLPVFWCFEGQEKAILRAQIYMNHTAALRRSKGQPECEELRMIYRVSPKYWRLMEVTLLPCLWPLHNGSRCIYLMVPKKKFAITLSCLAQTNHRLYQWEFPDPQIFRYRTKQYHRNWP